MSRTVSHNAAVSEDKLCSLLHHIDFTNQELTLKRSERSVEDESQDTELVPDASDTIQKIRKSGLDEQYLEDLREREFGHHADGVALLNNGSFGSCPKSVQAVQADWSALWLKYPCSMYYGPLQAGLLAARTAIASIIHCRVEEVVVLDNATTAASIVAKDLVRSFQERRYGPGDSVLILDCLYRALRNAFQVHALKAGAQIILAKIPFPVFSQSEILSSLQNCLDTAKKEHRVIRLAVFDHIVSMPSIILPVKEMVVMCRRYGVEQIFVDGAQAFGNLEIDVQEIDADYYTSNVHKWMFGASTSAFFHCKAHHLGRLHHPVVSHNYGKGLAEECAWTGTRDYSALLAIPAAVKFVDEVVGGIETIRKYNHESAVLMGGMLANAWGTHCGVSSELCSSMMMVALPPDLNILSEMDGWDLRNCLRRDFRIEVAVFVLSQKPDGVEDNHDQQRPVTAYLRISHQIYNKLDDYLRLRDAVNFLLTADCRQVHGKHVAIKDSHAPSTLVCGYRT